VKTIYLNIISVIEKIIVLVLLNSYFICRHFKQKSHQLSHLVFERLQNFPTAQLFSGIEMPCYANEQECLCQVISS